jgi:hypothetical protein
MLRYYQQKRKTLHALYTMDACHPPGSNSMRSLHPCRKAYTAPRSMCTFLPSTTLGVLRAIPAAGVPSSMATVLRRGGSIRSHLEAWRSPIYRVHRLQFQGVQVLYYIGNDCLYHSMRTRDACPYYLSTSYLRVHYSTEQRSVPDRDTILLHISTDSLEIVARSRIRRVHRQQPGGLAASIASTPSICHKENCYSTSEQTVP